MNKIVQISKFVYPNVYPYNNKMSSIKIVLRNDKVNKNGTHPIHFRIISNRKVKYISSTISVKTEQWNNEECRVVKIQNAARINAFLTTKFGELQNQILEVETTHKSVTQKELKEKIYGKTPTNFFVFTQLLIDNYKSKNQIALTDKYKVLLEKLEKFLGNRELYFQEITIHFLEKYEIYLLNTIKNKINTVKNDMKFIRAVYNIAITKDIIEPHHNPFLKFKIKSEKTQRHYLTEEEVKKIEEAILPDFVKIELHRDIFIFQCYGGGLRISDVLSLQWKQFDGSSIQIFTQKTREMITIKLPLKVLSIILKYQKIRDKYLQDNPEQIYPFIFPVYPHNLDLNNAIAHDLILSKSTAYINKNLKTIATIAKIEKNVSTHIGRHTFATLALKKGIRLEYLSKIMTHESIKTTQIYAKIVNSELDKAMEVMNF